MTRLHPLPLLAALLVPVAAHAGPYTDDLSKCLVASTTSADKAALVRWMFATASLHPAVKSIAPVSSAERDRSNRETARLFERLVAETCREQTQQAVKYEGTLALQSAFQLLGQVAARELFEHPSVAEGLTGLQRHLDAGKLESVLKPAP